MIHSSQMSQVERDQQSVGRPLALLHLEYIIIIIIEKDLIFHGPQFSRPRSEGTGLIHREITKNQDLLFEFRTISHLSTVFRQRWYLALCC